MTDEDVEEVRLLKKDIGETVVAEVLRHLEEDIEKMAEEVVAEELRLLEKDIQKVDEEVCLSDDVANVAEEICLSKEDLEKIAEEVCLSEKNVKNVAKEACFSEKKVEEEVDEEVCLSEKEVERVAEEVYLSRKDEEVRLSREDFENVVKEACLLEKEEVDEMIDEGVCLSEKYAEKIAEEVCLSEKDIQEMIDNDVCLSKKDIEEVSDKEVCLSEKDVENVTRLSEKDIDEVSDHEEELCLSEKDVEEVASSKDFYAELEEEREASATAVTEALSMILRLQREKAIEKMEACQYKRMAEEKMQHSEECLCLLKQVSHLKEMEINSLEYQLQAYQQKLASLGVNSPDITDLAIYGSRENSGKIVAVSDKATSRDQLCFQMDVNNDDNSVPPPRRRATWRRMNEKYDECEMLDIFYESEQGGEVNKKRTDILRAKNAKGIGTKILQRPLSIGSAGLEQHSGSSWYSAVSGDAALCLPSKSGSAKSVLESLQSESNSSSSGSESNTVHFATVHDIFEVPESHRGCTRGEPCKKESRKSSKETGRTSGMPNIVRQESIDRLLRDDDWLNSTFMARYHRSKLCTPSKKSFLNNGSSFSYCCAYGGTETSQIDFEQLKLKLKQLEDEHIAMQEDTERGREQMKLLGEIFKQVNTIETHMKSSMAKHSSSQEDSEIVSVAKVHIYNAFIVMENFLNMVSYFLFIYKIPFH